MKLIRHICLLLLGLVLSACTTVDSVTLSRHCRIGLINVPVEHLSNLHVKADSLELGINSIAGESHVKGEKIYEWWPPVAAPQFIEFTLDFKDGSKISKQEIIEPFVYNRFGIDGVYLVNANGTYTIETRYGIVREYDRTHSGAISTWFFNDDGEFEMLDHNQHLSQGQIYLHYENHTGKLILVQATRNVDKNQPRIIVRYHNSGRLKEIEIYHWDKPDGIEIFYSPNRTIRKVTRDRKVFHPDGVLLKDLVKEDITNQPHLYSGYKFPDLNFLDVITFDPEKALAERSIKLRRDL